MNAPYRPDGRRAPLHPALRLRHADGQITTIHVRPGFQINDLRYHPARRTVTLGKLTVMYGGWVYAVEAVSPRGR